MNLRVQRQPVVDRSLPGLLFINEASTCFTLENASLAIPAGRYRVQLTESGRALDHQLWTPDDKTFKLPELLDVPGRTAIRLHCANEYYQLEGCIALGATWSGEWLGSSQKTFAPIFQQLVEAEARLEDTWIDVVDPVKPGTETLKA